MFRVVIDRPVAELTDGFTVIDGFVDDAPGHVTGQGVTNFFVATPGLKTISSAKTTPTPPAATSGGGYGY